MGGVIEEQLVSLEVAELLKEKGFDEYCENIYRIDTEQLMKTFRKNSTLPRVCCSAPTQSLAQKWLREKHNLHITIYNSVPGYEYEDALEALLVETIKLI